MTSSKPDLSILIVNYNAGAFLERCLASVQVLLHEIPHEICVVDNASSDESLAMLKEHFPSVQVIANGQNFGFAKALNQALLSTNGKYCLWLNPDSELKDAGVREVITYFETNPEAGIIGPQIVNPDGSRQLSSRAFPSYHTAFFNRYSILTRLFPNNALTREYLHSDWQSDEVRETGWVSGAALFHRRELVHQIGLLDERFFMYCEDVDFCLRAHKAGRKVFYHPGMKVLHHIGASSRHKPFAMILEHHRSMWRYYAKHFKRNFFKDAVVGASICVRAGFVALLQMLKAGKKHG